MKHGLIVSAVLASFLVAGCGEDRRSSGDLSGFMREQIIRLGGNPPAASPSGAVLCEWRYRVDAQGVQIFTSTNYFNSVDSFYRSHLGAPDIFRTDTNGNPLVVYRVERLGVMVSYTSRAGEMHVTILKPQRF